MEENGGEKMTRDAILTVPAVAYYSGYGGIEIVNIINGINDYVEYRAPAWYGKPKAHRTKIYYNDKHAYFEYHGHRISFDDCIRVDNPSEIVRRIG